MVLQAGEARLQDAAFLFFPVYPVMGPGKTWGVLRLPLPLPNSCLGLFPAASHHPKGGQSLPPTGHGVSLLERSNQGREEVFRPRPWRLFLVIRERVFRTRASKVPVILA